jgi:MoaA/NifB/PqqE/SkfB family radical SAM enzyme
VLTNQILAKAYRGIESRKVKALALNSMRVLGLRDMVVRLDTTNLCNLRCTMCYYSADANRKRDDMDPALFRRIMDQLAPRLRMFYLSCATEPLMNKKFVEFLRITGEYEIPFTSFCTNGLLMNEEVADSCIRSKISEVIFSVDGATAETYERIRVGGKWERLLPRIDLLAERKRAAKSVFPEIRANFTCMLDNIDELPAMVQFAADHSIQKLHVRHLVPYNNELDIFKEQMAYVSAFNARAAEARERAKALGVQLELPDPVGQTHRASSGGRREANPYCMLPWMHAIINWKGDYRLCAAYGSMGNLQTQSFDEIYNSPKMKEIRNALLWRTEKSCSWDCRFEAHDAPEGDDEDPAQADMVSVASIKPVQ